MGAFETSFTIGNVAQIVITLGGGLVLFGYLKKSVEAMEAKLAETERDVKDLTKTITHIAVQDNRLDRLEQDMRDLRYGRGFVVEVPQLPKG